MVRGLYTAWTGLRNEEKRMDVVTNNMANADTTGYKKVDVTSQSFDRQLAVKIDDPTIGPNIKQGIGGVNLGVKIGETYYDMSQGNFRQTEDQYNLALSGSGFFTISTTDKSGTTTTRYTRDGDFTVTRDGYLVTKDGDYVLNQAGAQNTDPNARIRLNPNAKITIDELGNIYQNDQLVTRIGVVDFDDYNYISKYGENLYDLVDGGQITASDAKVQQGCIEGSNVNVVDEMVKMITISRAYQAGQKVINTVDETLDKTVNQVGKV